MNTLHHPLQVLNRLDETVMRKTRLIAIRNTSPSVCRQYLHILYVHVKLEFATR